MAERLAIGRTNAEIAKELDVTQKTVDTHRAHALKKLRLRNNVELTHWALRTGAVKLIEAA